MLVWIVVRFLCSKEPSTRPIEFATRILHRATPLQHYTLLCSCDDNEWLLYLITSISLTMHEPMGAR